MPKIEYKQIKFQQKTLDLINLINGIVQEYQEQGFDLTLRQVYYQLVARGFIPNNERSYKNLGNVLNDGRLAGLIDWHSIIDRTRHIRRNSHWSSPQSIIDSATYSYAIDKWQNQPNYVEVWVEKDALIGVVSSVCEDLDVPCFSCRGYVSQSEMWLSSQRFREQNKIRSSCTIIHLGDHDPSGIDMTRDIQDRLDMFGAEVNVNRIALTMSQIEQYAPPPNPTKLTDARANGYIAEYGHECWELDALDPSVLSTLIKTHVLDLRDEELYNQACRKEKEEKRDLESISENWNMVKDFSRGLADFKEGLTSLEDIIDSIFDGSDD